MNWEAIGAVGEILGAGAVVISLIYLAAQIRVQNREARSAATHEIAVGFRDAMATVASDPELPKLILRANDDFDALADDEAIRVVATMQRVLRVLEEAFIQHQDGRLDSRIWNTMVRQYSSFLSMQSFQRVWELRRKFFDDEFRTFVDELQRTEYSFR